MAEIVNCEACIYMYHCKRTYLGGCDTGVAWEDEENSEIDQKKVEEN